MFIPFRCLAVSILAALPLVACSTPAERELQELSDASEHLWVEYDACLAHVAGTPAYRRLDRAFILRRDDHRSVEKMTIARHASEQEKSDLLENKKNISRCDQMLFNGFAEVNPSFNVLLARFASEDDELILRTIQDQVTVGERNVVAQKRYAERLRDWNYAGERMVRLFTWRLRRACVMDCGAFTAAALMPTATSSAANVANAAPLDESVDAPVAAPAPAHSPTRSPTHSPTHSVAQVAMAAPPSGEIVRPIRSHDAEVRPAAVPEKSYPDWQYQPVKFAAVSRTAAPGHAVRPVPGYTIRLASAASEFEAKGEWRRLQAQYPAILGDLTLVTHEVSSAGEGGLVWVMAGLFQSRDEAAELCGRLNRAEQDCPVLHMEAFHSAD
ncbi:MAG: SPOR domain-containing protein [Kiloniellales bacterium]|nr:SPOR domain-containing protein [Kiloniellales bacterium]